MEEVRNMRKIAVLAIISTMVAAAQAGTIYDSMNMIPNGYFTGNGNHEGGAAVFGKNYGLAVGQPFTTTTSEFVITEVEVGNVTFGVAQPTQAVVSIYEGANWSTQTYRNTHAVTTNTSFSDSVFGLVGLRSTISGLNIALNPNTNYLMVVQTIDGDWAYTVRRQSGTDAWMRDQSSFGYQGGYGWTTWRSGAQSGFGAGEAAYRINAVPEPTALALLALGALGLIRRR